MGRDGKAPRTPMLIVNNILSLLRACQQGLGIALLPDYLIEEKGGLVQLLAESDPITLDAYFVYPEELKSVARVQVFRDFLVSKAQRWTLLERTASCSVGTERCAGADRSLPEDATAGLRKSHGCLTGACVVVTARCGLIL